MTTLLLVGATGLVGQHALALALADPRVTKVVAPTRRPLPAGPKLENPVVDFDALPEDAAWWQAGAVICTLGTTQKIAGSQAAFRKVDFDYPLAVARLARRRGTPAYALTSSVGASARSPSFYLRTKGELEKELAGVGFASLTIVRPSGIDGERNPPRAMESLGMSIVRHLGPIIPRRYRVVTPTQIAKALIQGALAAPPGVNIVESEAL